MGLKDEDALSQQQRSHRKIGPDFTFGIDANLCGIRFILANFHIILEIFYVRPFQ